MSWLHIIIQGLWVILPAYVANGSAPVFGGSRRMDFGKTFRGNDLLGAGKTWEGFLFAVASGTLIGFIQTLIWPSLNEIAAPAGYALPYMTVTTAFLLAAGAMLGDVIASFFKRRTGMERGESAPIVDQLDFLILSIPIALALSEINYLTAALVILITPPIHYLFNLLAYCTGIKEVPW